MALDAVVEASGTADACVALLPRGGRPELRLTSGLGPPEEAELRRVAAAALRGEEQTAPRLPAGTAAAALEVTEGDLALAFVIGAQEAGVRAFHDAAPVVLMAVARAALIGREHRREAEVARLNETARRVAASLDLEEVLSKLVQDPVQLLGADSGDVLLLDEERKVLRVVAVANFPREMVGFEMQPHEGLSARAMASRRPLMVTDYSRYRHRVKRLDHYAFKAVLCVPLIARGEAIGSLNVHATRPPHRFTREDARLLTMFANHAAIAVDNARRFENEVRLARELAGANEELGRSLSLQRRLVEQVLLDRGLPAVVAELATLLRRAAVVQDHLLRLLASAGPEGAPVAPGLPIPRDLAADPAVGAFLRDLVATGRARTAPPDLLPGPERLVAAIRVGGPETASYLVLEAGGPLSRLDRALVEVASTGVALELAKVRAQVEVERRLRGDVIMDLLSDASLSPEAISARAAHLGYDLSDPRDLLVLAIDDFEEATEGLGEEKVLEVKRRFFEVVHDAVTAAAPGSMVVAQSNAVIVLASQASAERGGYGERDPLSIAAELKAFLGEQLPGFTISAVIGARCSGPPDYAPAFERARRTLDALHRLGRRDRAVRVDDLGVIRLLISATSPEELRAFSHDLLEPLTRHDRERGTKLLETLRLFVASRFNRREAARLGFMHVNTIAYRLRRVEELLGVDLSDPDTLLDLTLALRVADLIDTS